MITTTLCLRNVFFEALKRHVGSLGPAPTPSKIYLGRPGLAICAPRCSLHVVVWGHTWLCPYELMDKYISAGVYGHVDVHSYTNTCRDTEEVSQTKFDGGLWPVAAPTRGGVGRSVSHENRFPTLSIPVVHDASSACVALCACGFGRYHRWHRSEDRTAPLGLAITRVVHKWSSNRHAPCHPPPHTIGPQHT